MIKKNLKSAIEAILFSMGKSVSLNTLCDVLEETPANIRTVIKEMQKEYSYDDRGIEIVEMEGSFQMCTKQSLYDVLIKIVALPKDYRLTDVQLETLSIIAYKQPITKIEIEKIRGVDSGHAVNRLIEAGLVEEKGRLNTPGRPILVGTTEEFLRRFGLTSKDDLPVIDTEKKEFFKIEAEEELGYISEEAEKAAVNPAGEALDNTKEEPAGFESLFESDTE
ncbi:MAG: SMC-Scp complex subunit ScpB [Parasporobacterium sp.]|nr:SMC-Scp complex subunit ScpB [Parasporobacterium sp.]